MSDIVPVLSFKLLHPTVYMFLEAMYGKDNLLLWGYTGSSIVPAVKHPNDIDIIVLVKDREAKLLTELPEWAEAQPEYDPDCLVTYMLMWFDDDADKFQIWDVLVMDDIREYADHALAAQLLVALDIADRNKRELLYQAIVSSKPCKDKLVETLEHGLAQRDKEIVPVLGGQ